LARHGGGLTACVGWHSDAARKWMNIIPHLRKYLCSGYFIPAIFYSSDIFTIPIVGFEIRGGGIALPSLRKSN
jgi:hypothetical protein